MPDLILEFEHNSRPIQIRGAGIVLRAPGLRGRATYRGLRTEGEVRIAATVADPDPIDAGLAEVGGLDVHQLEIQAPTPEVSRPENVRGDEGELRADELEADFACKPDEFTFAIYRDEDGVTSIHFPELVAPGETLTTRAPAEEQVYRYRIQLRPELGVQPQEVNVRGWGLVNKVLKFVVGKIAGRVAGLGIYGAVWEWERTKRKYQGLHGGKNLAELLGDEPTDFTDWRTLEGKRSLLFIHGTTSTTSSAFGELANFGAVAQQLYKAYENRVLGFNHHTLAKHVSRNVIEFYDKLPRNSGPYEFDVVCHSRGGLVARAMKELSPVDISHLAGDDGWHPPAKVTINRITFIGTPNNGTDLANPNYIPKVLNRLANIATLIPGAGLSIGGVLSWAALIAKAGLKALPGMVDQAPGSDLLLALNHPSPATGPVASSDYYAIQSNYEPGKNTSLAKAILAHTENAIVDLLFRSNPNDLIVPTLGVSKIDQGQLDAGRVKYFGQVQKDDVAHTRFFKEQDTWNHILTSLR